MTWLRRYLPRQLAVWISPQTVPLTDIIMKSDEGLFIQGRLVEMEQGALLREAADLALRNKALNLIREQVKYEAFVGAATKAGIPEDLTFYRAALWWGQREEHYLQLLTGKQEPDL